MAQVTIRIRMEAKPVTPSSVDRQTQAGKQRLLLRGAHRFSGGLLGAFLLLHLGNHLAGIAGQETHRLVQASVRLVYQGWVEPVLLLSCGLQVATGLRLAWERRRSKGHALIQPLSGLYLALFLMIHVGAVLAARAKGVETDLAFAAAGMHAGLLWLFFAPYYGLAVLALGLHLSVPLGRYHRSAARALVVGSMVLAAVLVALLAGVVTPLVIPPQLVEAFVG
jgi:succinate dehydrogenase hydrophobic anchor subunit